MYSRYVSYSPPCIAIRIVFVTWCIRSSPNLYQLIKYQCLKTWTEWKTSIWINFMANSTALPKTNYYLFKTIFVQIRQTASDCFTFYCVGPFMSQNLGPFGEQSQVTFTGMTKDRKPNKILVTRKSDFRKSTKTTKLKLQMILYPFHIRSIIPHTTR